MDSARREEEEESAKASWRRCSDGWLGSVLFVSFKFLFYFKVFIEFVAYCSYLCFGFLAGRHVGS